MSPPFYGPPSIHRLISTFRANVFILLMQFVDSFGVNCSNRLFNRPSLKQCPFYADNQLFINLMKTKELIFQRPTPRTQLPSALTGIERVVSAPLLTFLCSQRCYLLKCRKYQYIFVKELNTAFVCTRHCLGLFLLLNQQSKQLYTETHRFWRLNRCVSAQS